MKKKRLISGIALGLMLLFAGWLIVFPPPQSAASIKRERWVKTEWGGPVALSHWQAVHTAVYDYYLEAATKLKSFIEEIID
jgi:hypothetical protein